MGHFKAVPDSNSSIKPLNLRSGIKHGYHLYVVLIPERGRIFEEMREQNIGVNLHYIPVHLHPFYRENFGTREGLCPVAENAYREMWHKWCGSKE